MKYRPNVSSRQRGSALVMVLLVILVLSALALPLAFLTGLELQLGGAERVMSNNFYAAESGVHAALSGVLVTNDWGGEQFAVVDGQLGADRVIGHRVVTSRVQGVGPPQAPPLTIANEGEAQFHSFSVVMSSVAQRVSWPAAETVPIYEDGDVRESAVGIQAQSTHSVRYFLSPVRAPASADQIYNQDGTVVLQ